jgi:hypothetical protein
MLRNNGRHNFRSPLLAQGPVPSLILDFAGTGTLDSRVTFTRSTTGTYYNSSGVLSTAAIDSPRFDYDPSNLTPLGLLIEQSSTNLITYSQAINTTNWSAYNEIYGTTTIDTIAPDGTTSATTINDTSTLGYYGVNKSISLSASTNYTYSCYVKQGTSSAGFCVWLIGNNGTIFQNTIAWTAGVPTATGWIATPVGNGYYRISYSFNSSTNTIISLYLLGAIQNPTATGSTIFWGAMLEAQASSSSYIPTTSAQVTRSADNVSMTGTNFSSWYNATQGTFFVENNCSNNPLVQVYILSNGSSNRYYYSGSVTSNTSSTASFDGTNVLTNLVITNGVFNKIGSTYNSGTNLKTLSANASTTTSGAYNGAWATNNTLKIGEQAFFGWVKKISYYPIALTSTQLQAITT